MYVTEVVKRHFLISNVSASRMDQLLGVERACVSILGCLVTNCVEK